MQRLVRSAVLVAALVTLGVAAATPVIAADKPTEIPVTIENNRFKPDEIKVKAGQPFALVVTNKSPKAAEVESKELKFEKVVPPGKTVSIRVRALKPGTYVFVDDFNKSAQGKIVAE